MRHRENQCRECGWWDLGSKYGDVHTCDHCGATLLYTNTTTDEGTVIHQLFHVA